MVTIAGQVTTGDPSKHKQTYLFFPNEQHRWKSQAFILLWVTNPDASETYNPRLLPPSKLTVKHKDGNYEVDHPGFLELFHSYSEYTKLDPL